MKIVQKVSSRPETLDSLCGKMHVSNEKSAEDIIHDIRKRYNIQQSQGLRSTDTIDSMIQNSIGSSYNVAKPDYKEDTPAPVRDYTKLTNYSCHQAKIDKGTDVETQTRIISQSIGSQVQCVQSSVLSQANLLVLPTVSIGVETTMLHNFQSTQTSQQVVLLDDIEEIVSFMDDVVDKVTCLKESKEIQTCDTIFVSQNTQTFKSEFLDLGMQTMTAQIHDSYSQTASKNLSDIGVQNISKTNDFCFQTDSLGKVDTGVDPIIFPENDEIEFTKEQEEIFKQDFILNFLQEKLQEFTLAYEELE